MGKLLRLILGLVVILAIAGWIITGPKTLPESSVAGLTPDLERGEWVFHASGCASCHSAPDSTGEEKLLLAGGHRFATEFGTFVAPNISSDPVAGIGSWSAIDLANAVMHGTGPSGQHYYPAFPYASYAKMTLEDAVSLHAYLQTLPPVSDRAAPNEVGFPFNIRRSVGGWKLLFMSPDWVVTGDLTDEQIKGRYLVEALGHCGECHTPRNMFGGIKRDQWLEGAPSPDGKGKVPGISADLLTWSETDIAEYLRSGFTPEYDSVGGAMADVVENTAKLSDEDRAAIAAYLKRVGAK